MYQKVLARNAAARALQLRSSLGYRPWQSLCIYDFSDRLGIEVRFLDVPSMEGMYCLAGSPHIIISSLRPPGRQAFTCAHEVGHHVFNHGEQFDELIDDRSSDRSQSRDEFLADCFAGNLLMPKTAVMRGFALREADPATCAPTIFYIVATWLGVGYAALIHHMKWTLEVLSEQRCRDLLAASGVCARRDRRTVGHWILCYSVSLRTCLWQLSGTLSFRRVCSFRTRLEADKNDLHLQRWLKRHIQDKS